jgi:NhaA family Na+:H+ antiporter
MNTLHLLGAGFLASIGFTMSLFIGGLAFAENTYIEQAKLAILATSLVGSIVGYLLLRYAHSRSST